MANGRLKVSNTMKQARRGDEDAVRQLFQGFMGPSEQIVGCGYLGALGYILPEHSFWAVTDKRVCGLLIRFGGRVNFQSGSLDLVNSVNFSQPSLVHLWLWLIVYLIVLVGVSFVAGGFLGSIIIELIWNWFGLALWENMQMWLIGFMIGVFLFGLFMMRWVIRIFYRLVKSGCTFWAREKMPVFVFADRNNLAAAQRFMQVFAEEKREYR